MAKYSLILIGNSRHPSWWEDRGNRFVNDNGGYFPKTNSTKVLETVEAKNYEDLDHKKTHLYLRIDPQGMDGWCDPQGNFYPCSPRDHDDYAGLILKKTVGELERTGWVRCFSSGIDNKPWFAGKHFLTSEQRNTLSLRGFIVD